MIDFFNNIKQKIKSYLIVNWLSDSIFDKGKIIFMGVVLFFLLVKIIHAIVT